MINELSTYGFNCYQGLSPRKIYTTTLGEGEVVDLIPRDNTLPSYSYSLRINGEIVPGVTIITLSALVWQLKKLLGIPFETSLEYITREYISKELGLQWNGNRCLWRCMFSNGVLQVIDKGGGSFDVFIPYFGWAKGLRRINQLEWLLEQNGLLRVLKENE